MKKWIAIIALCFLAATAYAKKKEALVIQETVLVRGRLEWTEPTKGGEGYDVCLGSPYYRLTFSDGEKIKLAVRSYLKKNRLTVSSLEKMLGKKVMVKGHYVNEMPLSESRFYRDDLQRQILLEGADTVACDHLEVLEMEASE